MRQLWNNGNSCIDFIYDSNGRPYAMVYNGTPYYYVLNQQGDVIRVVSADGTTYASYVYDAWGRLVGSSGSMQSINPIRYRGYYYDNDIKMYYLGSRFYDPALKRFINADDSSVLGVDQGSLLQYNLFAYCLNNPVNRIDAHGELSTLAKTGVIVGTTLCVAALTVLTCGVGTATLAGAVAVGAAKGVLVGAAVGTSVGAGVGYATTGTLKGAATGAAVGFGAGAVVGAAVGGVASGSNYSAAAEFLKSNGANVKNTLSTFRGTPKVKTLKTDTTVYRTWGGASGKRGHWVSPNNYGSNARRMLALPPENTATHTSKYVLSKGTTVLSGKAASLFRQPGGGVQWWVSRIS